LHPTETKTWHRCTACRLAEVFVVSIRDKLCAEHRLEHDMPWLKMREELDRVVPKKQSEKSRPPQGQRQTLQPRQSQQPRNTLFLRSKFPKLGAGGARSHIIQAKIPRCKSVRKDRREEHSKRKGEGERLVKGIKLHQKFRKTYYTRGSTKRTGTRRGFVPGSGTGTRETKFGKNPLQTGRGPWWGVEREGTTESSSVIVF